MGYYSNILDKSTKRSGREGARRTKIQDAKSGGITFWSTVEEATKEWEKEETAQHKNKR
jgi:hypothetical protein